MVATTSQYCHVPHFVFSLPKSDATTPAQQPQIELDSNHSLQSAPKPDSTGSEMAVQAAGY